MAPRLPKPLPGVGTERVQVRNPIIDRWVKLDTRTGRIVGVKKSPGPYKNVPVYNGVGGTAPVNR